MNIQLDILLSYIFRRARVSGSSCRADRSARQQVQYQARCTNPPRTPGCNRRKWRFERLGFPSLNMVQFSWWWLESWVKFVRHILVPLELGSRKLRFLFFRGLWGAGIPLFACCVREGGGLLQKLSVCCWGCESFRWINLAVVLSPSWLVFQTIFVSWGSSFRTMLLGSTRCCCAYCQLHVSRFPFVPVSGHQGSTAWVCEPLAPRWAKGPGPNEAQLWIQSKRGHQITREFFSIPKKNAEIGWKARKTRCWTILGLVFKRELQGSWFTDILQSLITSLAGWIRKGKEWWQERRILGVSCGSACPHAQSQENFNTFAENINTKGIVSRC